MKCSNENCCHCDQTELEDISYQGCPDAIVYLVPEHGENVSFGWELYDVNVFPSIGEWIQHPEDNTVWVVRGVVLDRDFQTQHVYVQEESFELDYAGHPKWEDAPENIAVKVPEEPSITIKVKNLFVK
jgi:hypothetical protein